MGVVEENCVLDVALLITDDVSTALTEVLNLIPDNHHAVAPGSVDDSVTRLCHDIHALTGASAMNLMSEVEFPVTEPRADRRPATFPHGRGTRAQVQ